MVQMQNQGRDEGGKWFAFTSKAWLWFCAGLLVLLCVAVASYAPLWQPAYTVASPAALFTAREDTLDINAAPAEELATLPGIGPAKAEAIVEYRNQNGPFTSVEDLLEVPGIGPKTLEGLREQIHFTP